MGIASVAWYVILVVIDSSENILWDTISGLGFAIAFYYGITAIAAPILFRKQLTKSFRNFVLIGVVPVVGAAVLLWVFVKSAIDYFFWSPDTAYTPAWFAFGDFRGLGAPFVIGIGMLIIGIPLMFWWKRVNPGFFKQQAQVAGSLDEILPDELRVTEEATVVPEFEAPAVPKPKVPTE
jgi:hypothetical protein